MFSSNILWRAEVLGVGKCFFSISSHGRWRSGSHESFGEMHLHFVSHARKESQKESD